MVTYNRSLCDVEFSKYIKDIDIEVFEYVMMKIRENFETPTDKIKINFKDFTNFTNKHKNRNQSIKQSVERLDGITITTNIKSPNPSKRYKFNFKLFYRETKNGKIPKGFIVELDEKIYSHDIESYGPQAVLVIVATGGVVSPYGGMEKIVYDASLFAPDLEKRIWRAQIEHSGGTALIGKRMKKMANAIVGQLEKDQLID